MKKLRQKLIALCNEHEILRIAMRDHAALMDSLKTPGDAYLAALPATRQRFQDMLRHHAEEEEEAVASALLHARPDDGAALSVIFPMGMRGVLNQYDRLIDQWPLTRIRDEWMRYRESVLALQRQLAERMAWEEREVYLDLMPSFA